MRERSPRHSTYLEISAVVMPDGRWWHPGGWQPGPLAGWLPEGNAPAPPEAPEPLTLNARYDLWRQRAGVKP